MTTTPEADAAIRSAILLADSNPVRVRQKADAIAKEFWALSAQIAGLQAQLKDLSHRHAIAEAHYRDLTAAPVARPALRLAA